MIAFKDEIGVLHLTIAFLVRPSNGRPSGSA